MRFGIDDQMRVFETSEITFFLFIFLYDVNFAIFENVNRFRIIIFDLNYVNVNIDYVREYVVFKF